MKIRKRDGRIVDFNRKKIEEAVEKARVATQEEVIYVNGRLLGEWIAARIGDRTDAFIDIETIQDEVERLLMLQEPEIAKAYIIYREERTKARGNTTDKTIDEIVSNTNEYWKTENSNKDSKIVTTQRDYLAGVTSTDIARRKLLPKDLIQAHDTGVIHFHDMDYFAQLALTNCELVNLEDMLQNGTVMNGVKIDKPKRFITAMTIATQIILGVTSSTYGGCTISLSHLAPFIKDSFNRYFESYINLGINFKEAIKLAQRRTEEEVRDGVQTFNYQVNSMTNTNGQAPFLSVAMYLGEVDVEYKSELAMLIEEFLKQRIQGFKNEKGIYVTPAFPKLLYVLEEDNIEPNSDYYYLTELAAQCTAKRLVPDYISEKVMKQLKKGDCFPCMGCRSFLSPYTNPETGKSQYYGRFNMGVVTLNLPYIAYLSGGNQAKFWELFEEYTELCHKGLRLRYKRIASVTSDVAPILWQHGALARLKPGESLSNLLENGYASISLGYAGLYECVEKMIGQSHTQDKGRRFGLRLMEALNEKVDSWKEIEGLGYGLYGTPLESTTQKFARAINRDFDNALGRDYITNSYHVPVFEEIDAFTKLLKESEFQELSLGGAISYIETPNMSQNIEAVLTLIRFMYDNIMYAEINSKSDYCQKCEYDGEIIIKGEDKLYWECPNCGNQDQDSMNIARRTCGYIGTNYWNQGRTQEIKERVLHLDN